MQKLMLDLNSVEKVKSFVNLISNMEGNFDLISGRYVIDAKSILGIFSLDLSKPIEMQVHTPSDDVIKQLEPYICG